MVMALGRSVAACLLLPLVLSACAAFSRSSTGQTDSSSGAPSPRAGAAMAFDAGTNQVVMFGGGAFVSLDETWTWNGTAWSLLHPTHHPSAREHATMAFDAGSGQLLLFGGDSDSGMGSPKLLSDTWNWDGTDWHRLPSGNTPPAAANPHMAYDVATRQVVLLTQSCECSGAADLSATQTWTWDSQRWAQQNPQHQPIGIGPGGIEGAQAQQVPRPLLEGGQGPGGDLTAIGTEPVSGHVVVVEKVNYADTVPGPVATWTWTGSDWKLAPVHDLPSPAPWSPVLVQDAGKLVYIDAAARLWSWDGATWQSIGVAPDALRRGDDSAAMDSSGSLLIFGGVPASPPGGIYGDTWRWSSGTWSRVAGSPTPVAIAPPASPRPPHGITEAEAIQKAQAAHAGTPVRAVAGPMRKFWAPGEGGPDGNRWVWAVLVKGTFQGSCGPVGTHACPPPATSGVVFLDYVTGDWLSGSFPAPPQLLAGS
jgi:hypothetical protein